MDMTIHISELVSIQKKIYNPLESTDFYSKRLEDYFFENSTLIKIKNDWYSAIPIAKVCRSKNEDGYIRAIYIQINYSTNEYYIGKVNRKRWSEVQRYQGSGLRFAQKYKAHSSDFCRYYIALCKTAAETEAMEAKIVDDTLLADEKCLNLVQGGGGTSKHLSHKEISQKRREYMYNHPEQAKAMISKAKVLYQSGNTSALEMRNKKIKETMSLPSYREMTSERIKKWKSERPEEYQKARDNNKKALKSKKTIEKKQRSFKKWKDENPEKFLENRRNLIAAAHTKEATAKRRKSIREWYEQNPEQAMANAKKRGAASAEINSKGVLMKDLDTGNVLRRFKSVREAARWLVDSGFAKNINCATSISAVCHKAPCSTGYGYRKKAYGYGWDFVEKIDE